MFFMSSAALMQFPDTPVTFYSLIPNIVDRFNHFSAIRWKGGLNRDLNIKFNIGLTFKLVNVTLAVCDGFDIITCTSSS